MCVAPRAGAWIETFIAVMLNFIQHVAPRAGAWIETSSFSSFMLIDITSHPARVRGLKHIITYKDIPVCMSHPARVRGLKLK